VAAIITSYDFQTTVYREFVKYKPVITYAKIVIIKSSLIYTYYKKSYPSLS